MLIINNYYIFIIKKYIYNNLFLTFIIVINSIFNLYMFVYIYYNNYFKKIFKKYIFLEFENN